MPSSVLYSIGIAVKELPPRDLRVVSITVDPTTVDLVKSFKELAIDTEVNNTTAATTATVVINGETGYTINGSTSKAHSEVTVQSVTVSGITSGFIIFHVLPLSLLEKLNALLVK